MPVIWLGTNDDVSPFDLFKYKLVIASYPNVYEEIMDKASYDEAKNFYDHPDQKFTLVSDMFKLPEARVFEYLVLDRDENGFDVLYTDAIRHNRLVHISE